MAATFASRLARDRGVDPHMRLFGAIVRQAESDARDGDKEAADWLAVLRANEGLPHDYARSISYGS